MKALRFLSILAARGMPSDEQLMWQVHAADDHAAFGELVERWRGRIHGLCTRMVGDPALGEDLVQAAFARVYEKRREYRPSARFSTYLWRVAVNLCHDELRRARTRSWFGAGAVDVESAAAAAAAAEAGVGTDGQVGAMPQADLVAVGPSPEWAAAAREEGEMVRDAVMQLSEPYRTVLVLRHYQDLKLREIAEVLEVPEGTVNSRLAEALTRLARVLGPRLSPNPNPNRSVAGRGSRSGRTSSLQLLETQDPLTP